MVIGDIELSKVGDLKYGDWVTFDTTVDGKFSPKSRIYIQVLGSQGGKIVYQWSADPGFSFPLVQQDGLAALGIMFDPSQSAGFVASLIYREDKGQQTVITTLDKVEFSTVPI